MANIKNRTAAIGLSLAVALGVAACSPEPPTIIPAPQPTESWPVVTGDQLEDILASIGASMDSALDADDPDRLAGRVTGPAQAVRTADMAVADADGVDDVTPVATTLIAVDDHLPVMVTGQDTWPREIIAFTETPGEADSKRLVVLRQNGPRDNYVLWAWVRMLPGVQLSDLPAEGQAVRQITADDDTLSFVPDDIVKAYIDVLNEGDDSDHSDKFAEDSLREQLAQIQEALDESLEAANGSRSLEFSQADSPLVTLTTAGEGAIVVAELSALETLEVPSGATLSPSPRVKALLGDASVGTKLNVTYTTVIAFHIPPADAEEPVVTIVGVEHTATSARTE